MDRSRIFADIRTHFGFEIRAWEPVSGGWLNRKYKLTTDAGTFLVKQFSMQRYSQKKLLQIEAALQRQRILYAQGVPCPRILITDDRIIRHIGDQISYMVMEYACGFSADSTTVTPSQLQSLGSACAWMHKCLAALPYEEDAHYPLTGETITAQLHAHYRKLMQSSYPFPTARVGEILSPENTSASYFDRLPKSLCHEDFAADNLLFSENALAAILDFDRGQYSFPLHDVGRALMSFAFDETALRTEFAAAFCRGYREHLPFAHTDLADALRLTWYLEMPWWFQDEIAHGHAKVRRFLREILYLTEIWDSIAEISSDVFSAGPGAE